MNPICRVCGDEANGLNYNEFTCTPCKVFFHRNFANSQKFKCRKVGNCEIDIFTRKRCCACRLSKCLALGMKRKPKSIEINNTEFFKIFESMIKQEMNKEDMLTAIKPSIPKCIPNQSAELNKLEWKLIYDIRKASCVFGDETRAKITRKSAQISDCFLMPDIYFRWITEFCAQIEPFNSLTRTEQLKILKSFCFDLLCLRIAFQTDALRDGFPRFVNYESNEAIFIDLKVYRAKKHRYDFMDFFTDYWFTLQREMEDDLIIRDLLAAQMLFNRQENMSKPECIKYHYTQYSQLLHRYLEAKYRNTTKAQWKYFALMKLVDQLDQMRLYEQILCSSEVESQDIPHLVVEMFDFV